MEHTYESWLESARQAEISSYADALLDSISAKPPASDTFLASVKEILLGKWNTGLRLPTWFLPAILLILLSRLACGFDTSLGEKTSFNAFRCVLRWMLVAAVLAPVAETAQVCCGYMRDIMTVFGTLTPVIGILLASGGNVASAKANHLLLSVFLSAAQFVIERLIPAGMTLFFGFAAAGAAGDGEGMQAVANWFRNTLFRVFALAVTVLFIVIGYQNIAAINADTAAAKTLRTLVNRAVPIVGNALGDAMRLVGGGLAAVRSTVGLAAALYLVGMFVPIALTLFMHRTVLSFLEMLCQNRRLSAEKGFFAQIRCGFDFMTAAFAVLFALCVLNLGIFLGTLPQAVIG